jgi:hypothetical protein
MILIQLFGEEGDTLAIVTTTEQLTLNSIPFRVVTKEVVAEILTHESVAFCASLTVLLRLMKV